MAFIPVRQYVLTLATLSILLLVAPLTQGQSHTIDLGQPVEPDTNLALEMLALGSQALSGKQPSEILSATGWTPVSASPEILEAPKQHSSLWLKARLTNSGNDPTRHWLEIAPFRLNKVSVWIVDENSGDTIRRFRSGLHIPVTERPIEATQNLVPVTLSTGQSVWLLLHIESENRPYLNVIGWDPIEFTVSEADRYQFHSILLAIILTLFAVLLLQMNSGYFLLGLWMLALFLLQSEKEGYISYFLFPEMSEYTINLLFSGSLLEKSLFLIVSAHLLGLRRHRLWRWVPAVTMSITALSVILGVLLGGAELRILAVILHLSFLAAWLAMVPAALGQYHRWQYPMLGLLALNWGTTAVFVIRHSFNIEYSGQFAAAGVIVEIIVVVALLLIYARQRHDHSQLLEQRLRDWEKTERHWLERAVTKRTHELNIALEEARKANTAKTRFLSQVTHDLKSPLTSIMGYAQLLRGETGRVGQMSGVIFNSANHMLNLVTHLINYACNTTGREPAPSNFYLQAFLDGLGQESTILASKNRNRFQLSSSTALCPVICCDETFLRTILLNLVDNASKYTEEGEISLHVTCRQTSRNGTVDLSFVIEDTGCGVEPELQKRLFDPFYQVPGRNEGTGLGLSIVSELVKQMEGTIKLTSKPAIGTRVVVTVPVQLGQERAEGAVQEIPAHVLPQLNANGREAWIVEDASAIRELLVLELETIGFRARSFNDAESTIEALRQAATPPALIITDHHLPGAPGGEVLQAAQEVACSPPVILLSATWNLIQGAVDDHTSGYAASLGKPVDLVQLRTAIARACGLELDLGTAVKERPPQSKAFQPDEETLLKLHQWIELGAVTDLVEWCERTARVSPEHAERMGEIGELAERGDFSAISQKLTYHF